MKLILKQKNQTTEPPTQPTKPTEPDRAWRAEKPNRWLHSGVLR